MKVFRPQNTIATPDHNVPTIDQHLPIKEELSRIQVEALKETVKKMALSYMALDHQYHGIVHIIGPELGITQPGMTIVAEIATHLRTEHSERSLSELGRARLRWFSRVSVFFSQNLKRCESALKANY